MPNSKADTAKPASAAGSPGAGAKHRPRADRPASADASAPMKGVTITRWSLGISLTLAVTILGGAFTFQSERISGVESEVRDLRGELHTEINGLRQEVRADIRDLRHEMRTEIGTLREDMSALREEVRTDIGELRDEFRELRDEFRELADLIRARDTPDAAAQ